MTDLREVVIAALAEQCRRHVMTMPATEFADAILAALDPWLVRWEPVPKRPGHDRLSYLLCDTVDPMQPVLTGYFEHWAPGCDNGYWASDDGRRVSVTHRAPLPKGSA